MHNAVLPAYASFPVSLRGSARAGERTSMSGLARMATICTPFRVRRGTTTISLLDRSTSSD